MPTDFPANAASNKEITPEVTWAQRSSKTDPEKNFIYLTISVPDVSTSAMKLDMKPTALTFTGHSESKKATYHVELEFYEEIDPDKSQVKHSARDVEIKLQKKELKEVYWPRLLKDKAKVHFLKTDFDKWVDEDEQDGLPEDDPMNQFGGGGMPGMGADGGFGGLDFSKLGGGAGGMPDMGDMGGFGGEEDGEDDDGDDDMPALGEEAEVGKESKEAKEAKDDNADAAKDAPAASAAGKIEEVE